MLGLTEQIAAAIFRQEGMGPTSLNPGNLRGAPWLVNPVIAEGFWVPTSRAQGVAGAVHVIALHVARGESLRQLITAWAPPVENETATYIKNVSEWAQIPDVDAPLWGLLQ